MDIRRVRVDSWRLKDRLTLNLGVRFDRYRLFLPAQEHPAGSPTAQQFAAVDNLSDWNVVVPRLGAVYDLTGTGRHPGEGHVRTVSRGAGRHRWLQLQPERDRVVDALRVDRSQWQRCLGAG